MNKSTVTATRTSARIEARQGSSLPGWAIPTGNNDERRLMQALLDHIQATDDIDDTGLYRYLYKESEVIRNDLKTLKVFRWIRAQLASFRIPYVQYNPVNRKWMYWNDYTLTGLTAWRDQKSQAHDDPDAEFSDDDTTAAEDMITAEDASATTTEDPTVERTTADQPNTRMAEIETSLSQVANPTTDDATAPSELRHPHRAQPTIPETVDTPSPPRHMAEPQQSPPLLQARTSPSPAQPPGHLPTQQWFQSPPPRLDPTTGHTYTAALPVQMQRMVAELTDQADWYESDTNNTTPSDQATTPRQSVTIDLITPPTEAHPSTGIPDTLDARFRAAAFESPGTVATGLTPHSTARRPRESSLTVPMTPRLQVLLENTLDTLTEHARALEEAAMERHRLRMERSQDVIRNAIQDAVELFKQETSDLQLEQQADLQRLRDQHAAQLAEKCDQTTVQLATTLAQATHQMEQLRTQVSARLYSGELVTPGTPGAATDSPALEPVHGAQPAPAPPSQSPPIPSEARPTSTG